MGEEADYLIERAIFGPRKRKKHKLAVAKIATITGGRNLTMDDLTATVRIVDKQERTVDNMPDRMKEAIATLPQNVREIHILAWLMNVQPWRAKKVLIARRAEEREAEAAKQRVLDFEETCRLIAEDERRHAEILQRRKHQKEIFYQAKITALSDAKTIEDLKPLLHEIITLLWRPK